ncbi:trafficking protein particle complex subunit 8-like [Pollicipes pollicipes]|uniref:trafficking protein particle complex subunit 8-like n=1 Tax=Pollicipes pollicipes TaxID=41117 RepID=UPI0018848FF3|nr:trafficking protein particle complex subunit 8-like [Pollicipes pollicipes]
MRALSDVVNNRKGVSRSLLSATKRWFGGKQPGSSAAAPANSVIYSHEAPEIQVRRLGDLAFMFGHYDLAYQAYHTAKRDFNGDSAWLHFAGAVEMAALSVFLHGAQGKAFPQHYLDQAVTTYLDTCRMPNFALRATLFSTECLKDRGQFAEAALQFIRLTAEDADLRSALLLEQAAHCFLNTQPAGRRKYAFHMILSGHRFAKAGQRRHSLRAYQQALQVYEGHGWRLADDHIAFTLARHSETLQDEARQSAAQQTAFVREYLQVHRVSRLGGSRAGQRLENVIQMRVVIRNDL